VFTFWPILPLEALLLYWTLFLLYIFNIIVPQYINITTKCSSLKLLFFSFSRGLTIERPIVFKTMDRQCESFSRIFSSTTRLDESFMFIRNTLTSSSINENSEIFTKFKIFKNFKKIQNFKKNFMLKSTFSKESNSYEWLGK
jgi:hypothetical protein